MGKSLHPVLGWTVVLLAGALATALHVVLLLNPLWTRGRWLRKFYGWDLNYYSLVHILL